MEFGKTSQLYSLNKSTYINLRWIGIIGQFITINSVRFIFDFEFNYIFANLIILIGAISNLFLIQEQEKFAKRLCELTKFDSVGFQNSGAESTELAIKAAVKYFYSIDDNR